VRNRAIKIGEEYHPWTEVDAIREWHLVAEKVKRSLVDSAVIVLVTNATQLFRIRSQEADQSN
jgi:hypothetical protein